MAKKRITELATETTLKDGQYVAIDHTTDGTKKLNLGAELTALKEDLEALETQLDETTALALAALPQETIENVAIASFDDGGDGVPVKELKVGIEPIQSGSGDPSPTNVRPISGRDSVTVTRTGKNIFGGEAFADTIMEKVPNATIDREAKTVTYSAQYVRNVVIFDDFKPNTQYSIFSSSNGRPNLCVQYADNTVGYFPESGILTTKANNTVVGLIGMWDSGTSVMQYDLFGVFEGVLTSSDFEEYQGDSYPIPLSSTIYGGTLDVGTGTLTVDMALVTFDGSETWVLYVDSPNNLNQLYTSVQTKYVADKVLCVCDKYKSISIANRFGNYNTCYIGTNSICFNVEGYDVASWKTYLASNNVTVAYYIPTPTTVQLTPAQVTTLLKDNNIFADSGNIVKLIYRADLGAYIQNLINA